MSVKNAETKFNATSIQQDHLVENGKGHSKGYGSNHVVDMSANGQSKNGSTITVHNVHYRVSVKTKPCCGQSQDKEILKEINGVFPPGMNAILGPTGSGKSSLLDILAGRKDPVGLSGDLLIDGSPPPDNFKCMVGYVVQDDVVMGTLTVRENFQFSAALRLPSSVSSAERKDRVNTVIDELGLHHCADTKVGNEFIRGISGGERKRTNIGMELIISPPVLFLDEPTTGLDANTANSVMLLLKRLALRGRTIIFSIHQPRYSIYRLFDSLMLLSLGETVYHGPTKHVLDHLGSLGFHIEEHNNPPDFFLDVINGDTHTGICYGRSFRGVRTSRLQSQLQPIMNQFTDNKMAGTVVRMRRIEYASSFFKQVVVMLVFAAIVGAVYWQIDNDCKSGIQNRVGAFFFIIMNQIFGNLSAVELFIKERAIFMHENVSGFYRVSAYFFSKVVCDVIPMRFIPVSIFAVVVYFMLGLQMDVGKFFIFLLTLFMTTLAASGLAFFFSATVRIFAIANLCIALCYVFMMVFGGLLVNLDSIGDWLAWLKWISIFRYGLNALNINELKGMVFYANATVQCEKSGNDYLIEQGVPFDTDWDLWLNVMALGLISFGFLFFSYIQLLRLKKLK
ncbi:hypothetical protein KUTeg_003370 [Tegillarca granosa]|uniref:ABC transporter domain-containing protein n=1 Tax=Tegillarca granosa TaxID=220873 RepID=A0ABQ9FLX9_TEGGR|nr:hypothetical protein KUTeg_003370 [Tegillarca granosa]